MVKHFDLVISEPGAGKSYQLVSRAIEAKLEGESVYIATPTHASKQNLVAMMKERKSDTNTERELNVLNRLVYDVHVFEEAYNGESEVFIDEIGQWSSSHFNSLLLKLQSVDQANIHLTGDIKQLVPSSGSFSPLEALLRNNLTVDNFWDWVSDKAYNSFDLSELKAPKVWRIDDNIKVELLTENHRLNKLDYQSYDNDFFDSIIETKTHELTNYTNALMLAIENYSAILVATKRRGKEANQVIQEAMNSVSEFQSKAYFVQVNNKTYLNPDHYDFETLKEKFSGVPEVTPDVILDEETVYKFWATVHSMQGITVDSVVFYMGNKPIANGNREHYNENMFYTSVTRASNDIVLLGLKESFQMMRHQQPTSPQNKLGYYKAEKALSFLFDQLSMDNVQDMRSFEQVQNLYSDIFHSVEVSEDVMSDLDVFNVSSQMYTDHQLAMSFKNYPQSDAIKNGFKFDYTSFYNEEISKVNAKNAKNSKNAKGKGRVQVWIKSLTTEELEQVTHDVTTMSQRKFKATYNMTQDTVKKALGL